MTGMNKEFMIWNADDWSTVTHFPGRLESLGKTMVAQDGEMVDDFVGKLVVTHNPLSLEEVRIPLIVFSSLVILSEREVRDSHEAWRGLFLLKCEAHTAVLLFLGDTPAYSPLAAWQLDGTGEADYLLPAGLSVLRPATGDVGIVGLFHGAERIDLEGISRLIGAHSGSPGPQIEPSGSEPRT
jgi:hypothetical protein